MAYHVPPLYAEQQQSAATMPKCKYGPTSGDDLVVHGCIALFRERTNERDFDLHIAEGVDTCVGAGPTIGDV